MKFPNEVPPRAFAIASGRSLGQAQSPSTWIFFEPFPKRFWTVLDRFGIVLGGFRTVFFCVLFKVFVIHRETKEYRKIENYVFNRLPVFYVLTVSNDYGQAVA